MDNNLIKQAWELSEHDIDYQNYQENMMLLEGRSRLSHHTITTAGMTFSVPSQEDFTIRGTSQSWTMASLALSEKVLMKVIRKHI